MLSNWDILLARGIFHPLRVARHVALFTALFSGRRTVKAVVEDLEARRKKHPFKTDKILLTDEDVCMQTDLSLLGEFRDHYDVKVIFALRRQDLWLESWYLQNIKWQWNTSLSHCTLTEFLAQSEQFHWVYYDRLLRHLEGIFGQENVLPYAYETAQMPKGPVDAFCDRLGLTDMAGLKPAPHMNHSNSTSISEFVRGLPFDEAPEKYRAQLEKAVRAVDVKLAGSGGAESTLLMDHATRTQILAKHAEGNAAIAKRYFGRDELFLEPLPAPDAPLAQLA